MNPAQIEQQQPDAVQSLPWYRYPWPWVAIAIPAVAVVGGLFTLYLAISNPDPLIVDDQEYQSLYDDLKAQPQERSVIPAADAVRDRDDGDD